MALEKVSNETKGEKVKQNPGNKPVLNNTSGQTIEPLKPVHLKDNYERIDKKH